MATSTHVTAEYHAIMVLTELIMSCNQPCMFLSTAKILRQEYDITSHSDADGNVDDTHFNALRDTKDQVDPLPTKTKGNLLPDHLADA